MSTGQEIRLVEEDEGGWSAIDEETGVVSQEETREETLANLDEAVELTLEVREADTDTPGPDTPVRRMSGLPCEFSVRERLSED